jgi:putative membrane protein
MDSTDPELASIAVIKAQSRRHLLLKKGLLLAALAGLLLAIWLIVSHDAAAVFDGVADAGWGLVGIVSIRAVIFILLGISWGVIVRPFTKLGHGWFILLRWIRESINDLLPVAAVGGDLIGARLLAISGVAGGLAGASILVDLLIQAATQVLFTLVGLVVLVAGGKGGRFALWIALGLLVAIMALGAFYLAQRHGLFERLLRWLLARTARWSRASFDSDLGLHSHLLAIYGRTQAVSKCVLFHVAAWFVGVGEVWIALAAMGQPPTLAEALVLESLGQAVRGAAFLVPAALGIQEGGFLLLGHLYGIDAQAALAVALIKRIPELVLGSAGLVAWYVLTVRRWLGKMDS